MFSPNRDLFHSDQVPDHFRELFIVSGYRYPGSTLKQCIISVFKATNETLNFWTHFLPALYFWYVCWQKSYELDFVHDVYTWPLGCFYIGMCLFPITSATAHVFNNLSDRARHICFFFDYAALSMFTMGASIAYKSYIFPEALINGVKYRIFLPVAVLNSVISLVICCQTRFMPNCAMKKVLRIGAFSIPYFFDSLPMVYRLVLCSPSECLEPALVPHKTQFVFAFLAALMYTTHMPERYFPGLFDIVGHSHQLFHIFTIIGCHLQMQGLTMDMMSRRPLLTRMQTVPSASTSAGLMIGVLVIDVIVLAYFIHKICHVMPEEPTWRYLYGDQTSDQVHGVRPIVTSSHRDGLVARHHERIIDSGKEESSTLNPTSKNHLKVN